jgi:hypothetical protein
LLKLTEQEEQEDQAETTEFIVNDKLSTSSSKYIIRKRTVTHSSKDGSIKTEVFEDTFTIPLHKFNLNLILSQTKNFNIEETVILSRKITQQKKRGYEIETEEIVLPTDTVNLESVLPMIDYTDICNIRIVETRRQIIRKKVSVQSYKNKTEEIKI